MLADRRELIVAFVLSVKKKKLLKILLHIKDETVSHTEEWYYNFSPLPYLYKKEIKWLNMENISSADFIIGL